MRLKVMRGENWLSKDNDVVCDVHFNSCNNILPKSGFISSSLENLNL